MAYQTNVRAKQAWGCYGIEGVWGNGGTDLANNDTQTIVTVSGKAGRLNGVLIMSKHPDVEIQIYRDGIDLMGGFRERPSRIQAKHGCCGEFGFVVLQMYDTVNDKYVVLVKGPLEFGDALTVALKNNAIGEAIKCCGVVDYVENT